MRILPRLIIVQNIKLPESLLSDDVSDNLQRYLGSRVLLGRKTPSTILKTKNDIDIARHNYRRFYLSSMSQSPENLAFDLTCVIAVK